MACLRKRMVINFRLFFTLLTMFFSFSTLGFLAILANVFFVTFPMQHSHTILLHDVRLSCFCVLS